MSVKVIFAILIALSYLVSPVMLIWGWATWARRPKSGTVTSILSLVGFSFATASAALAVSSIAYAQIHHFVFYDPLLLRIFRWGLLLSLIGLVASIAEGRPLIKENAGQPTNAIASASLWVGFPM